MRGRKGGIAGVRGEGEKRRIGNDEGIKWGGERTVHGGLMRAKRHCSIEVFRSNIWSLICENFDSRGIFPRVIRILPLTLDLEQKI